MGSIGNQTSKSSNIVTMIHYTSQENVNSLLNNEFDFNRSGEGAGAVWGAGAYYLEKGSYEDDMYSVRLNTESYIQSDIDTTDFLIIDTLKDEAYRGIGKMYDDAAQAFNKPIHREYTSLKNKLKREGVYNELANKRAFNEIAQKYYSGLIIKHRVRGGEYIDPLSGGNQIVVYNQKAIKNKKKGHN